MEKLDYECDTQDRSSCFEILETGACPDEQPDFDDKAGCAGCPTYGDINDESKAQELKNLALEIAEESLRNDNMWNDEDYCGINLISVENYASSVSSIINLLEKISIFQHFLSMIPGGCWIQASIRCYLQIQQALSGPGRQRGPML